MSLSLPTSNQTKQQSISLNELCLNSTAMMKCTIEYMPVYKSNGIDDYKPLNKTGYVIQKTPSYL